jgi:maltose phosphorylase
VIECLKTRHAGKWTEMSVRLDYKAGEELVWTETAGKIYTVYNSGLGINEQHAGFSGLDDIDLDSLSASEFPLESHWPWPKVLQHKVLKQPDVLLAGFLLNDQFSREQKAADYKYYEPLTTHDSSLSPCIHSILAAELDLADHAFRYLENSARLDLEYSDASQGIHLANASGAWMCIVCGLAGYRQTKDGVSFAPAIFKDWKSYSFRLKLHGSQIEVSVTPDAARFELLNGGAVGIRVNGETVMLENCATATVRILQRG